MASVKQVLATKGSDVWSVAPESTVYAALQLMAEKNIGAVLVMEKGNLAGIFSERDYARKLTLKGKSSKSTAVRDLMTSRVYCIQPDKTLQDAMGLMTVKRVRHLPVVEHERVIGLISIGDVVRAIIAEQKQTIEDLEIYIFGNH